MRMHNAMAMGAALSYRTVFAMVPAIVIAFLVLKASGVVADSRRSLHKVLEAGGLTQITMVTASSEEADQRRNSEPTSREVVNLAEKIEELVARLEQKLTFARLGPVGLILLAWTAIGLLTTIEQSLNRIFEAPRTRPLVARVLLYWSAITFVPVVMTTVEFLASRAMQTARHAPVLSVVVSLVDLVGSLVIGILVLALVYKVMPNTHVGIRSALAGASVVVPIWILGRWGFGLYVSKVVGKGSVYGALGLVPLFLFWINLCWYGFLLGAELAYAMANLRRLVAAERSEKMIVGPMEMLAVALVVAEAYARGAGPAAFDAIAERLALPGESIRRLTERLKGAGILCPAGPPGADAYVPARPTDSIRIFEIMELTELGAAEAVLPPHSFLTPALRRVRAATRQSLGEMTLSDLIDKGR
jgi:membrane protein